MRANGLVYELWRGQARNFASTHHAENSAGIFGRSTEQAIAYIHC